jgi:S-adenosylmethionine uptake transporter
MAAGGALGLTEDWVWPSATLLAETAGAGLCLVVGHWFIIIALRSAPVSLTAPFNYTNVIWAIGLELVIWGTRPDLVTLAGAALIVASGAYILYREQAVSRRREPSIGGLGP